MQRNEVMHFLALTYLLSVGVRELISRFADVGYKGRPGSLISQDPQSLNRGLAFYVFTVEGLLVVWSRSQSL